LVISQRTDVALIVLHHGMEQLFKLLIFKQDNTGHVQQHQLLLEPDGQVESVLAGRRSFQNFAQKCFQPLQVGRRLGDICS